MSVTIATRPLPRSTGTDPPPADPVRAWLSQLSGNLPLFAPLPFAASESCTPIEAHAAARAAACPDLFLIHALDPVVGERVIGELARLTSEPVLILSPDPAAADRITERLARFGVLRALADDENPIRPSPVVAKLTSAALGAGRLEQLKREALEAVARAEARLVALDRLATLDGELAARAAQRGRIEDEVRAASTSKELAEQQARLAELRQQLSKAAAPRNKSGLFGWLFGRSKSTIPSPAEIEKEVHVLEAEVGALTRTHDNAIHAEVANRCASINEECAAREDERKRILVEVAARTREAIERDRTVARERLNELTAPDARRQLLAVPRLVVGTPASLTADPVFDARSADGPPFGLLVLDRCEELAESDFLRLAPLAARWVLVGSVTPREEPRPHLFNSNPGGNGKPPRKGRAIEHSFAARLARLLDRETWIHDGDRLVCRLLHTATSNGQPSLTREPLLDRPDIELCFATDGNDEPVVAEVAFPAATSIAEAKSFLFHQLGEVLLHPCGAHSWDQSSALAARWPAAEHASLEPTWIDLEPGVREKVAVAGLIAFTAAIEFDPAQGWDRDKAEAWLAKHLRTESAGRFAMLPGDGKRR